MRKIYYFFLIMLPLLGCEQEDVLVGDVLSSLTLSKKEVLADGQTAVSVQVNLNEKSSADRRNVIFSTNRGVFINSGSNKYTAKAVYEDGLLVAKASLRVPIQPGTITVSAEPEFDSPYKEFRLVDSIKVFVSIPASLKLVPSSLGIASNFQNEVKIVGKLENASGGYVSMGHRVLFEDVLLSGQAANGRFRDLQTASSDTSTVSVVYGAGPLPVGTTIKIRGTVLDANGMKTSVSDSILLQVNQ